MEGILHSLFQDVVLQIAIALGRSATLSGIIWPSAPIPMVVLFHQFDLRPTNRI